MNRLVVENAHVEREFELVSAVDLDNDGIIDRVYGVEKIEFKLGSLFNAIPACSLFVLACSGGR